MKILYKINIMKGAADAMNRAFAALADPTRRAILHRLVEGETTVLELAKPFRMSQPAVSQHLKVLEQAGLITRRVDGTRRPCRLSPAGIDAIDRWLEVLRGAMSRNYERLDELLAKTTAMRKEDES
jgi:DNA-binding transcriptional ArsR family regulator